MLLTGDVLRGSLLQEERDGVNGASDANASATAAAASAAGDPSDAGAGHGTADRGSSSSSSSGAGGSTAATTIPVSGRGAVGLGVAAMAGVDQSGGQGGGGGDPRLGDISMTRAQRLVKACFFLWVSLANILSVSALWTLMVDVFPPDAGKRLFGFVGAGATIGQLVGSSIAVLWSHASSRVTAASGSGGGHQQAPSLAPPFWLPLLLAAVLYEAAGRMAQRVRLRTADSGSGGGSSSASSFVSGDISSGHGGGGGGGSSAMACQAQQKGVPVMASVCVRPRRARSVWSALSGTARTAREGVSLAAGSPYLRHLCAFLLLNYAVSSCFYFAKSNVVAAAGGGASGRARFFALVNTGSAAAIAGLQLAATGRVLKRLGMPAALSAAPCWSLAAMACVAAWPRPSTVAWAEVSRKMLIYSLARPAREVLYTVLPRHEKYKVKLLIDTCVNRAGDAVAAMLFKVLDLVPGMGPSGTALAAMPLIAAWAVAGITLGRRHAQAERTAKAYLDD